MFGLGVRYGSLQSWTPWSKWVKTGPLLLVLTSNWNDCTWDEPIEETIDAETSGGNESGSVGIKNSESSFSPCIKHVLSIHTDIQATLLASTLSSKYPRYRLGLVFGSSQSILTEELAGAYTRTAPKFSLTSILNGPCFATAGEISVSNKKRVGDRFLLPGVSLPVHKSAALTHLPDFGSSHHNFVLVFPLLSTEIFIFSGSIDILIGLEVKRGFPLSSSKSISSIP